MVFVHVNAWVENPMPLEQRSAPREGRLDRCGPRLRKSNMQYHLHAVASLSRFSKKERMKMLILVEAFVIGVNTPNAL